MRQLNFNVDNLYEIRSGITHDSRSSEFDRISSLIFQTESRELLTDRKPNIKIDRKLLRSSIIPISLRIIDEDQQTDIGRSTIEAFYRKVKYVSINAQQDKPKAYPTLEYHVTQISKNKDVWQEVCKLALSPIERLPLARRQSAASNASSLTESLFGFSMSNE